jgi:hypothetical protein
MFTPFMKDKYPTPQLMPSTFLIGVNAEAAAAMGPAGDPGAP